jgi:hypothetical protein
VRRTAWGLGRLARNAGVLGGIGLACCAAGGAGASRAPDVFALTIRANAVATFDHTDCELTLRAVGSRSAVFRSSRPTLVRFVAGRIQPVVARSLRGTVSLTGTNRHDVDCAGEAAPTLQGCVKTTRRFTNARVALSSSGAGSVSIRPPRVALLRVHCPEEPSDVVSLPLGLAPGPLHLSVAALANPRTARLTFTASARRRKTYGSPDTGFVQLRSHWIFTLVRTGR